MSRKTLFSSVSSAKPFRARGVCYHSRAMSAQPDPDAALMLRVKRGDRAAFTGLVEKYKQPVLNFVFRSLRDETAGKPSRVWRHMGRRAWSDLIRSAGGKAHHNGHRHSLRRRFRQLESLQDLALDGLIDRRVAGRAGQLCPRDVAGHVGPDADLQIETGVAGMGIPAQGLAHRLDHLVGIPAETAAPCSSAAIVPGQKAAATAAETEAKSAGARPISLGPLVLRCETAAIYCLSVVNHELSCER